MNQRPARGKWIFLSVLTLVAGALGALAIWAFAIRDGGEGPTKGPAAPLTQGERDSLVRFHALAANSDIDVPAKDVETTCGEVVKIIGTTPFSPFDTSGYPGAGRPRRWSPLPGTAHWAAASDLEALTDTGRLVRQLTLRSVTEPAGDVDSYATAVKRCYERLFAALEAATA